MRRPTRCAPLADIGETLRLSTTSASPTSRIIVFPHVKLDDVPAV